MSNTLDESGNSRVNVVLGGLGFIGSNVIKHLVKAKEKCIIVDNEVLGHDSNLGNVLGSPLLNVMKLDATNQLTWTKIRESCKDANLRIWHLAANSDISLGAQTLLPDVKNTLETTVMLVENMVNLPISEVVFASSSAVYGVKNGEVGFKETQHCFPISYYGVSKLTSEQLLEIACERLKIPLWNFRFANIVGTPSTHGVIFDFVTNLISSSDKLMVRGNGNQCKTYLHVDDLIRLMDYLLQEKFTGTWNIGPGDRGITVSEIASMTISHLSPLTSIQYEVSEEGWPGDVPLARLNCTKMNAVIPFMVKGSKDAVHQAIHEVSSQFGLKFICNSV